MKKMMSYILPAKTFAAMIFTGFICLYMMTGSIYAVVTGESFDYAIPFAFVLQGLILSLLISLLWAALFNNTMDRKLRYFPRLLLFSFALTVAFAVSLLTFVAIPTGWTKIWLIADGCVAVGVIILSFISEVYYKATGKRYTELLKEYQLNQRNI